MDEQNPDRGQVTKRILRDDDLPPDLLDRALDLPEAGDGGHLFEWVMQLGETLSEEEAGTVGDVLSDGVLISAAGSGSVSRKVTTLTFDLRSSLQELMEEESRHHKQATFVLALDVQNRVHNEVSNLQ